MGTSKPPSPTTALSAILAAASKLGGLRLAQGLLRIAPGLPAAALAGVAILFFAWSCEHGARQREAAEAQQAKNKPPSRFHSSRSRRQARFGTPSRAARPPRSSRASDNSLRATPMDCVKASTHSAIRSWCAPTSWPA